MGDVHCFGAKQAGLGRWLAHASVLTEQQNPREGAQKGPQPAGRSLSRAALLGGNAGQLNRLAQVGIAELGLPFLHARPALSLDQALLALYACRSPLLRCACTDASAAIVFMTSRNVRKSIGLGRCRSIPARFERSKSSASRKAEMATSFGSSHSRLRRIRSATSPPTI